MKHRSLLFFLLLILLSIGGIGFWLRFQQHQYALNRQLIAALVNYDRKTALALVKAGAAPNHPDNNNITPLMLAQQRNQTDVVALQRRER